MEQFSLKLWHEWQQLICSLSRNTGTCNNLMNDAGWQGGWWRKANTAQLDTNPSLVPKSGPSVQAEGGWVLLRPSYQLLCRPLWRSLIKRRLDHGSIRHNRLQQGVQIFTVTGWLPISAPLLSWENTFHSTPAGGKNWSGLSVILAGPEITINHHLPFHGGRSQGETCHPNILIQFMKSTVET